LTSPISIVVPVYNESDNVLPLVGEIRAALSGLTGFELIFVDDGSEDGTSGILATANDPELRVIRHRERCGQSTALLTGVRAARSEWVVTLDGDGQNDPGDIPRLLAARDQAEGGLLLVTGFRRKRRDSWIKRLSSRVANSVRSRVLGDDTTDTGCGLKLFQRDAFLELPYFDHMHRFLPALFQRNGGRVLSVDVSHRERQHGRSKYGVHNRLWVGTVDMLGVMWLKARMQHPTVEAVGSGKRGKRLEPSEDLKK
jgi:dolichol-phosphate mannosyltransferase